MEGTEQSDSWNPTILERGEDLHDPEELRNLLNKTFWCYFR